MTTPDRIQPPIQLNDEGQAIWDTTLTQLDRAGTLPRVDPDSLLAYVMHVLDLRRASGLLQATDILVDRDGTPVPNPALAVKDQASAGIARFAKQFGLNRSTEVTPMSRRNPETRGRWCEQHSRWECIAPRSRGRGQCHALAVLGRPHCPDHAGVRLSEDPAHLLAIEERRNPLAGTPMDIGPAEALLWRVRVYAGEVQRLDEEVARLEADELYWGPLSEVDDDATGRKVTRGSRLHLAVQLRTMREQQLQSACQASLQANIEHRLVRLAEQQGAVMHKVILAALRAFEIDPDDPRIPEVMPMIVRELTAG